MSRPDHPDYWDTRFEEIAREQGSPESPERVSVSAEHLASLMHNVFKLEEKRKSRIDDFGPFMPMDQLVGVLDDMWRCANTICNTMEAVPPSPLRPPGA